MLKEKVTWYCQLSHSSEIVPKMMKSTVIEVSNTADISCPLGRGVHDLWIDGGLSPDFQVILYQLLKLLDPLLWWILTENCPFWAIFGKFSAKTTYVLGQSAGKRTLVCRICGPKAYPCRWHTPVPSTCNVLPQGCPKKTIPNVTSSPEICSAHHTVFVIGWPTWGYL